MRQNITVGSMWWSKAAHFMAASRQCSQNTPVPQTIKLWIHQWINPFSRPEPSLIHSLSNGPTSEHCCTGCHTFKAGDLGEIPVPNYNVFLWGSWQQWLSSHGPWSTTGPEAIRKLFPMSFSCLPFLCQWWSFIWCLIHTVCFYIILCVCVTKPVQMFFGFLGQIQN